MHEWDDIALLREYVERDCEEAFSLLVARHVNKVYSVALRHTRNPAQAQEITQAVFVILAKKAPNLSRRVIVSGWLYQAARLTAVTYVRTEIRRSRREQEAHLQSATHENESDVWIRIAPLLDAALAALNETDRHAVVLRFFDGKSMREVGAALGANEDAAKKRVNRALEKLQKFFFQHGISSTTAIIAGAISANSVQAAPAGLATSVAAAVKAGNTTTSIATITKTTLKIMTWTKLKTSIAAGALAILLLGTASVSIHRARSTSQSSPAALTFAGYATPEASVESSIWAGSVGDFNRFLNGSTDEQAARFRNKMAGKSDAEIRDLMVTWARALAGYKIDQKDVIADDEVHLHISATPSPQGLRDGTVTVIMKKIGVEWKQSGDL